MCGESLTYHTHTAFALSIGIGHQVTIVPLLHTLSHSGLFYFMRSQEYQRSNQERTPRRTQVKITRPQRKYIDKCSQRKHFITGAQSAPGTYAPVPKGLLTLILVCDSLWPTTVPVYLTDSRTVPDLFGKEGILGILGSQPIPQPQEQEPNTITSVLCQGYQDTFWCGCIFLHRSWSWLIHYELQYPNE